VRFTALPALLSLLAITGGLCAQSLVIEKTVELLPDQFEYQIADAQIVKGSESVTADTLLLSAGTDYVLDHQRGVLRLLRFPDASNLHVDFILVPPSLRGRFFLYEEMAPSDSLFRSLAPRKKSWMADDGKLLISGAKTFAITFSDDNAFDLKQSLFVNLNGELSRNVNISAQLSDSQSKLTPEGDSKELSSLDKVYIRVFGRQYEIAMGDLDWKFEGTRYINYQTSIEGLNAWYRDKHYAQAGFTAASGKTATLAISIIDGKQGPYYLNPTGFQSTYMIIAGSEQIYRNGSLLERGTDYYIDYSEGSVMFRSLVVSSDLVNAYFQYADEYYKQSTYFNSSQLNLLPGLSLSHHFIHQADAKDNPLLYEYSPSDLDSLGVAGDNIAWGNGITEVNPGSGTYIRKFTTEGIVYYEYAASDSTAAYNVNFSYVGSGNGDYEEFSSGKFRYVGEGMGAWLPQKRLVPAVKRTNADLALSYGYKGLELGVEGIYTVNDKNTFSTKDDGDNLSGLLYAWGGIKAGNAGQESYLRLAYEKRWADSYLFSQTSTTGEEYDFSILDTADSLARDQIDLTLGSRAWTWWKPELLLRYSDVAGLFGLKALRLVSRSTGKGILPALDLRSTLSLQDYDDPGTPSSVMQYHDLSAGWDSRWLKAKLLLNYNSLDYTSSSPLYAGSRYYRINPQVSIGDQKLSLTQLGVSLDDSSVKETQWTSSGSSQTYTMKHTTTTLNHSLNLDLTHREVQKTSDDNPKSSYNLASIRNSHHFFKQAIMLMGNYQLNQTEFFPKIRELEYIGDGLGLYDSLGVYTPDGDWDYVYITSDQGTLSTELNAQLSLYLKPGNYFPKWKWIRSDLLVQATEQSPELDGWRGYLFLPGSVFSEDSTIFGKQNLTQTLWLDILPGRIMGNLSLRYDRSLDNRYQNLARTSESARGGELDLKNYLGNNYNLKYEHSNETDTRYMSDITSDNLNLLTQRNFSSSSIGTLNLSAYLEEGVQQSGTESYRLRGIGLEPGYRGSWGAKGRISGSFGIRYNDRSGSNFLNFLPDKREGVLFNWSISAVYRLNNYTSATFEYSGNAYPEESTRHSLKLEFKAEL
jgi:hypothetical protein